MGKLYGRSACSYFEIIDNPSLNTSIDLACAAAYWEDENYHYQEAQKTAGNEAGAIDGVMDEFRKQQNERG